MSRSVRSLAMTKGGTPCARASARRCAAQRLEHSAAVAGVEPRPPPPRRGGRARAARPRVGAASPPSGGSSRRAGRSRLHHRAARLGEQHHRPVAAGEVHPARGHAAAQQPQQPVLRVLAQDAEGGRAVEARPARAAGPPRRAAACTAACQAEAVVDARHARTAPCARPAWSPPRPRGASARVREGEADVAAPAACERLRLVAEVAEDRVVAAAAALRPAHQLEEQAPLVRDHPASGRRASLPRSSRRAAQRHVARGDEQQAERGRPSRPARPTSW